MRKLWMQIAVVLFLFAGVASAKAPKAQLSSPTAAQAPSSQSAAPASAVPMQPFTSADGRFSILFPGAPAPSSQAIHLKNGETVTLYEFSAEDDGGNTSYIVMYNDYAADVITGAPQELLKRTRDGAVAGKTLLTDMEIELSGVPGRAYTATDTEGWNYSVREYLSGTRFYQLIVTTAKGHTPAQVEGFMNSFRIL